MKKLQATPQTLSRLYGMINGGQASQAVPYLQQILEQSPAERHTLHLMALANAATGNPAQAREYFTRTLAVDETQHEVHNNFANFLKQAGDLRAARHHYQAATEASPGFADAWRNLAVLEYELKEYAAAREHALKARSIQPRSALVLGLLGNICRKSDRLDEAEGHFKQAIKLKPDYINAIYGLAVTYSAMERNDLALPLLERALQLSPGSPEILYAKALAQTSRDKYESAVETLDQLLETHPLYVDAHRTLNEIHWQQGNSTAFCKSYRDVAPAHRGNIDLAIAHIESLLAADQLEEAERQLRNNWNKSDDPRITFLRGRIIEEQASAAEAIPLYERAYAQYPELSVAKQLFIALIRGGQVARSQALLESYIDQAPNDQLLWALLGTCWKMQGDDRYRWLNRDNSFVQEFEIPVPEGFSNRAEFLTELRDTLVRMHNLKAQPLNQSVRAGIQTPGRLLHKHDPIIQALRASLADVVRDYIGAMPNDSEHPLLRRKAPDFSFSGSWSVMLRGGGHHVSHVHPQGWISSAFYVSVPREKTAEMTQGAGDIYFGQSPYRLGQRDVIEKQLTPSAGKLVLFPSYTWHGTIPLPEDSEDARITTPFDAIPA